MDRSRMMMIAAVMTGIAVLALGFFVGVQPQLSASTEASTQQAGVEQQNAILSRGLEDLRSDSEQLSTLKAELSTLQSSVPSEASMASFLTELGDLATASGATITSFTPSDASAYQPEVVATPSDTTASTDDEAASDAAAAAIPAAPVAPSLVTDASITAANFSTIPIEIGIQGSYAQARDFLGKLQTGDRLFLVTAFSSAGAGDGASSSATPDQWTVGGLVYVLQDAAATQADQAAETPATTAEGTDDTSSDTAAGE